MRLEWTAAGGADARSGHVDVVDVATGRTVQRIEPFANYYVHEADGGLDVRDLNNDGCPDLVVTQDLAAIGNRSVLVYLYDRTRHRFVQNDALSGIGDPTTDDRDPNCVTGFWKGGDGDYASSRYCWRGGRLVLVSDFSQTPLYDRETREFACYEQVETTYVGKRKRVRRKCVKTP